MPDPDTGPHQGDSLTDEILAALDTAVLILDQEGRIVRFNRASEEFTGYSAQEAVGQTLWDLLIDGEEADLVRQQFSTCRDGTDPVYHIHFWLTKDGHKRLMKCRHQSHRTEAGEVDYILAIATDITDQRSTEAELTESRTFLNSIINASPVAIVTIDAQGKILSFSRQAELTFGGAAADVIGKNISILMPEPDRSAHDGYLKRYLETGTPRILGAARSLNAKRLSGEVFPAILHVSEFRDGELIFVGFIEDVTEQREAERHLSETQDQLQHAGRLGAMGEMATTIAHELNQPLTAASSLVGAAQLTLQKNTDERSLKVVDLLEDSVGEIQRASDIIRQMRDFIRKRKTVHNLHDISQVVAEASSIALMGAEAEGITVEKHLPAGLPPAMIDRIQIQQVVTNLIRNAMDAMADTPVRLLTIATGYSDGMVEISVEDTGTGIDETVLAHLFEPFLSTKEDGTGVGLSISKSIIDAHQGRISAKNKDSSGCIFTVSLPAGNNNEQPDSE